MYFGWIPVLNGGAFGCNILLFVDKSFDLLLNSLDIFGYSNLNSTLMKLLLQTFLVYGFLLLDVFLFCLFLVFFVLFVLANHFKLVHCSQVLGVLGNRHESHRVTTVGSGVFERLTVGKRLVRLS